MQGIDMLEIWHGNSNANTGIRCHSSVNGTKAEVRGKNHLSERAET